MENIIRKDNEKKMNKEDYLTNKYGRYILPDEIVIEFDDPCPDFDIAMYDTISRLLYAGYNMELWNAMGMKCMHLHIKNIYGLDKLDDKIRRRYKELFIKNYVDNEFFQYVDLALCGKHRIAEENKPHWKYGTEKKQVAHYNEHMFNNMEDHIVRRAEIEIAKEKFIKKRGHKGTDEDILEMAAELGIGVTKNRMAICPFHPDKIPSMMLYYDNHYHCFGCQAHGYTEDLRRKMK